MLQRKVVPLFIIYCFMIDPFPPLASILYIYIYVVEGRELQSVNNCPTTCPGAATPAGLLNIFVAGPLGVIYSSTFKAPIQKEDRVPSLLLFFLVIFLVGGMLPPKYVESPCFPIHSIVRRFDLTAGGGSVGTVMQRVGTQPPSVTRASDGGIIQGTMDLVLFPCQLGDPTRPTGWPPAGQQDFTVMVNESYVTSGFPRCPTRSASHRTLAGLPLSPFLPRAPDGTIAPEAQLKICVVSRGKWTATFLLAWCGVVEIDTVVERTVSRLIKEQRATPRQEDLSDSSSASASGVPGSVEDSDIDIDSGWVDDAVDGAKQPGGSGEVNGMGSSGCAADRTSGHDPGVDDGEAVVTLRCPLSYSRIQMAGRGRHCTHLACFDVVTFVKSCLRSNSWNCPICDGPILIDDVRMDRTVQAAIDSLGPDEYSVVLFGRGYKEWRRNDCVPCVSDDDDDECESTRGVDLSSDYHQSPLKSALE